MMTIDVMSLLVVRGRTGDAELFPITYEGIGGSLTRK